MVSFVKEFLVQLMTLSALVVKNLQIYRNSAQIVRLNLLTQKNVDTNWAL